MSGGGNNVGTCLAVGPEEEWRSDGGRRAGDVMLSWASRRPRFLTGMRNQELGMTAASSSSSLPVPLCSGVGSSQGGLVSSAFVVFTARRVP